MAGGESKEVSVQRQRENRTLEAVYPRPSAIPERYYEGCCLKLLFIRHVLSYIDDGTLDTK